YSIPLIPDSVSWWIVNASDRTIISLILNVAENGIYAVANKFSSIYTGVFNVFSLSWNESLSVHINDEDAEQYINNVYGYVFRFFFSISMLIVCAMPIIGGIFITNDYNEAYLHIPILMFAAFINVLSTYISAIYFAKKKTKQIAKTSLIGALINIIINISLIKEIGLFAASISTLLSYLILFIYRYIDTKRYFKIDIFRRDKIVSIIYGIIVVWIYYLDNMILNYLNFIILLLFILIVNKNDIKKLILFIHKRVKLG
ncbi:MAG: polysaccharide biosynthesis C-terminal domain-containing protein, partial [Methanosphaera sp.]|nr:polysaccharide biosynthesis C-terminal domain-containing protein [Methanosphaera sp.]